jgi:hypothetical protein
VKDDRITIGIVANAILTPLLKLGMVGQVEIDG